MIKELTILGLESAIDFDRLSLGLFLAPEDIYTEAETQKKKQYFYHDN